MNINIKLRGIAELKELMKTLPRGTKILGMETAAKYLVGDENHGLSHEPEQKTHNESNPYQWQSEKQRRAYFATDGFGGGIPYKRTHELAGGWVYSSTDSNWTSVKIENIKDYAGFVMGDQQQRGHAADGWRYYLEVISTNIDGAIRAASNAVSEFLKRF